MNNRLAESIDNLGVIKAQIADLERVEKEMIDRVKSEMLAAGVVGAEGVLWKASFVVTERIAVDCTRVKAQYPQEEYPLLYKQSYSETLRVSAR